MAATPLVAAVAEASGLAAPGQPQRQHAALEDWVPVLTGGALATVDAEARQLQQLIPDLDQVALVLFY